MIKLINVCSLSNALEYAIKFCASNEEKIEIVVPDKLSLFMEKFLFEKLNIESSFNISVSTLNRFAKRNLDVDKSKMITSTGSVLLIHKILNENLQDFYVLKSRAYSFSYAEEIFKTITQLKASKINFEEMKLFKSKNIQLQNKILDLAKIYELYEKNKAGLLDSSDMFLLSAFSVANGRENSKILFVGFDDFTAIEYTIIERLAQESEVSVINYFSNNPNKNIYSDDVYYSLKKIAYTNELDFKVEDFVTENNDVKDFLTRNLFGLNKETFVIHKNEVRLFSSNHINSEIEFVARDIREKILSGHRFSNFGVAVFDLESHIKKIKEIFSKYEINCYIDTDLTLNKSIFYKFLCSVFKYNLEGHPLFSIIDIINSPFCMVENEKKRIIIERLITRNYRGKIDNKLNLGEDVSNDLEILTKFFDAFTIDENEKIVKIIEKLKNACTEYRAEEILNEISQNVPLEKRLTITKSVELIYNLFDDILAFYPSADITKVFEIFASIAPSLKFSNLPLGLDVVKIVDANDCMEKLDNFYIVNCTSDHAPMYKTDCGIIIDSEINELNFSNKLSPTIAHINRLSKLRLYNTVTLFNKTLTITYSKNESDLIAELKSRLVIKYNDKLFNLPPIIYFEYGKYIALSKWDEIGELSKNNKNFQNLTKFNENLIKYKDFSKINEKNLKIFDDMTTISASQLESYFKCPFSAFLNNILKIRPRIESEILSLDVGNILHEICFKYYKLKKQVGDIYQFVVNEVYNFVTKDERLKLNAKSPILTTLIDEAYRVINGLNYIDENSLFTPKYFECEFKGESALKFSNINIIGKIDRVDEYKDKLRIIDYKSGKADASLKELFYGNKLQLFLYALAMENHTKKSVVGEFYLPLHNAYSRESSTYSLKGFFVNDSEIVSSMDTRLVAGMKSDIVNIRMNKGGIASKTTGYKELSFDEMSRLKNYAKNISIQAVDEIKSGYIAPSPSDISNPCKYCAYSHICMRSCSGVESRVAEKVNLDSFKEEV